MSSEPQNNILVSACLLGIRCRYDGSDSLNTEIIDSGPYIQNRLIPVCPEQLGGLSTPREPCEIESGSGENVLDGKSKVVGCKSGTDYTKNFLLGAEQTLILAQLMGCRSAVFKNLSPSCGKGLIKKKGEILSGNGVTTALLEHHEIVVKSVD